MRARNGLVAALGSWCIVLGAPDEDPGPPDLRVAAFKVLAATGGQDAGNPAGRPESMETVTLLRFEISPPRHDLLSAILTFDNVAVLEPSERRFWLGLLGAAAASRGGAAAPLLGGAGALLADGPRARRRLDGRELIAAHEGVWVAFLPELVTGDLSFGRLISARLRDRSSSRVVTVRGRHAFRLPGPGDAPVLRDVALERGADRERPEDPEH